MRFMVLVKADRNTEAGVLPDEKAAHRDGEVQRRAGEAGVMLAGEDSIRVRKARAFDSRERTGRYSTVLLPRRRN